MKTIKQQHDYDCGVACVAMLAGVSYETARAKLFPTGGAGMTKTKQLQKALRGLGKNPEEGRLRPLLGKRVASLEVDAIVMVKMIDDGTEYPHWIVWDAKAGQKRDPYPENRPHRATSYLTVR